MINDFSCDVSADPFLAVTVPIIVPLGALCIIDPLPLFIVGLEFVTLTSKLSVTFNPPVYVNFKVIVNVSLPVLFLKAKVSLVLNCQSDPDWFMLKSEV